MHNTKYIAELLKKSMTGALSASEEAELLKWAGTDAVYEHLLTQVSEGRAIEELLLLRHELERDDNKDYADKLQESIANRIADSSRDVKRYKRYRIRRLLHYAAILLMGVATISLLYLHNEGGSSDELANNQVLDDIQPGGNRAKLTLMDGRTITLDEVQKGIIITDDEIFYDDGSSLLSLSKNRSTDGQKAPMLELATPKGGTYQISLPDGSKVWLNAATTLRYPTLFDSKERVVEVVGEAYFDITSDHNRPFKVKSRGQVIEVLGTAFNIAAYPEESNVKTSLVEGRVIVRTTGKTESVDDMHYAMLQPGEQAVVTNGRVDKSFIDVAAVMAWKSGKFHFDGKPLDQIMNEVSRWYDLDVVYRGEVPSGQLVGDAYRSQNLSIVLKMLEVLEINYDLNASERILTIYNKKGG